MSRQRVGDLLIAYGHSLEQQIVGGGSSLVCRDEELWKKVEELLRDGDAQEMHCLGLDPLAVMEESLKKATASTTGGCGTKVRPRGGLRGLDRAFEVLEQAALNLYLTPWREEYKVVKMYSGPFTHYIKPVLSMPQIEKLFGLLGYHSSSSQHLCLQLLSISPSSVEDLLRLSCAFYLARCECRLLQVALGKHIGEAQWELRVVRERQRGHSVQVAVDNTIKTLKMDQPLMEPFDGEVDVDLYTDDHVNGGQTEPGAGDNETWLTQTSRDDPTSVVPPLHAITYHDCCDLALLDPRVLCLSCGVFHSDSCRDLDTCQLQHSVRQLGVCVCGKPCSRKPLVLCRYCGNEFCRECWYRNPVFCTCGQTFDQSSSV